ncbi:MAG: ATP synthase subunit I [Candidatus Desulfaltia sp.]|nr:ATP synthase subunit I [Candidatus Desulfaltia sp.]
MKIQQRILKFVIRTNWILFFVASIVGIIVSSPRFAMGIIFGGLIVTINFHLLYRTLKKALTPPHLASLGVVLSKYYIRFILSALIIFVLISRHYVDPIGLFIGLSVVVVSITLATMCEFKKLIFKEAI